jgi:hypothetical protein
MCNLYSIRGPRDEVIGLFGIFHVNDGFQRELPAVYPDTLAPIIKLNGPAISPMMRWGFPPPPKGGPQGSNQRAQHQKLVLAELAGGGVSLPCAGDIIL